MTSRILHQFQGQGQDHEKVRRRSAPLQLQMVLALTLTLVLTLELVQDSASQPYLSWMTMFWITMSGGHETDFYKAKKRIDDINLHKKERHEFS